VGEGARRRISPRWRILLAALVIVGASVAVVVIVLTRGYPAPVSPLAEAPAPPPELAPISPLSGPIVIAIQPGHWQVADLPDELWRLRGSAGASFAGTREVDVNRGVAAALAALVEAEGWKALIVPATVPPGLRADAFVALHADWGDRPSIRGWKIADPWRASRASKRLSAAIGASMSLDPTLVEDRDGITIAMRGYFAFSYRRFAHALSPYTPAAILEMGFLTNADERRKLVGDPAYYARLVMRGLKDFISESDRGRVDELRPVVYPWVAAGLGGALARQRPDVTSRILWTIEPGSPTMPVDDRPGWYEVFLPRRRATAWVMQADLVPSAAPIREQSFPEPTNR
jgi:N-acetylmuramoyl-L-alanine amidase